MNKFLIFLFLCCFISLFSQDLPEMIYIPAGKFIMGIDPIPYEFEIMPSSFKDTYTPHEVELDAFHISKYEITNKQFITFSNETKYKTEKEKKYGKERSWWKYAKDDEKPVVVIYEDMLEYCKWLSNKTNEKYRLPTEAEWEYAACGGKKQNYPWGKDYKRLDGKKQLRHISSISYENDVYPVTRIKEDVSPFGVFGMYGNISEIVLDFYDFDYYSKSLKKNPLCLKANQPTSPDTIFYVVRGVYGYFRDKDDFGIRRRGNAWGDSLNGETAGFRIVREIKPTQFNADIK